MITLLTRLTCGLFVSISCLAQDATNPYEQWRLVAWLPDKAAAHERAASLRALQQRFVKLGVGVRLMLPPADAEDTELARQFDGVMDAGTTIDEQRIVIETTGGRVLWGAADLDGVADILANVTSNPAPAERLEFLANLVRRVEFYISDGPAIPESSARLVELMPTSARAHAFQYIDALWNRADRAKARNLAAAAFSALAADPWATTTFCDLVLRSDPYEPETRQRIERTMQAIVATSPHAAKAWLVWLRAAVQRDAAAAAAIDVPSRLAEFGTRQEVVLEFVEVLASAPLPAATVALLQRALKRLDPSVDRQVYWVRAKLALAANDDGSLGSLLDRIGAPGSAQAINHAAWTVLTKPETMGCFDAVALALMERLQAGRAELPPEYRDTLALARYGAGDAQAAAALEAEVAAADPDDPRYDVRRRRFASASHSPATHNR